MADAAPFIAIWYLVLGLVTTAMTMNWRGIRCLRASLLWPAFWSVVVYSALRHKA